jgi:hypothetical protein
MLPRDSAEVRVGSASALAGSPKREEKRFALTAAGIKMTPAKRKNDKTSL